MTEQKNIKKYLKRPEEQIIIEHMNLTKEDGLSPIYLTIKEKLNEIRYSTSEILGLTQKYHAGIMTRLEDVDNVLILISFNMG